MSVLEDSPSFNRRQAWLALFLSQSAVAAARLEPTMENPSKANDETQQSRSRPSSIREKPSHQASLMAGICILGPSVVPCLVETSTAHGDLLFSAIISSIGLTMLSGSVSYFSNLAHDTQISPVPSPNLPEPPEYPASTPYGRRLAQICRMPTKLKLGFQLVGSPKAGPISFMKPNYKRGHPHQNPQKPRYILLCCLSSPLQLQRCFSVLCGRRHHVNRKPIPLILSCGDQHFRTLSLNPFLERWCDSYHQNPSKRPQPGIEFSPVSVPQLSRTMLEYSRKTSGFTSRTALLLDLKGPRRPRTSIVESTSAPPSSVMERNRSNLLVAAGLASARHEAKNPSLTPQNLLIMAVYEIPESFVEVSLTHPSLACDMLLVSLCFRDPRDLSFNLFVCLIHLLYVCKIVFQNFVSYVPLFWVD